jgi:excinuclease ABC subunit A
MKFRVSRGAFKHEDLVARLNLKTLNQMDELPIYGNEPRVRCRSARGPWQEVEIRAYSLEEIDTPAFWSFVERAVGSFQQLTAGFNPEEVMPWKKLGQRWHFLRKGFTAGRAVQWDVPVLEKLVALLTEIVPDGQFQWTNQVLVHFTPPGQAEPWATLITKRCESLDLVLQAPKNAVAFGRAAGLAWDRELDGSRSDRDVLRLRFRTLADVKRGDLPAFLREHLAAARHS